MWVGLGLRKKETVVLLNARQEKISFTPETQSRFFKKKTRPLPKSNLALLRRNRSMMLSVLDMYFEEIEKNKQLTTDDAVEDEDDNSDATPTSITRRVNSEDDGVNEMHENLRTSPLLLLEQISTDKSTDPVGDIEGLLKSIRESKNAKQQARLSLVSGNQHHAEEQVFETRESSSPTLSQIGIPVTKRLVSSLLREIVALSCLYPDCCLLSYQTHRGTSCELVKVTRSKNKESFVTNVRRHQSWLHQLPSLVVAESVVRAVEAAWILKHLAMNYEDQFVHVCRKIQYS